MLISIVFLCIGCEKEEFDEYTGIWESKYSTIKITKTNKGYTYNISDKNGENSVNYINGMLDIEKGCVSFESNKGKDTFNYDEKTKQITWTIGKNGKEYITSLKNTKKFKPE
jgi:hypothetical protein